LIHLDTSYLIRALVRGSAQDKRLRGWLRAGESIGMSTIAWAEFLCGPVEPHHVALVAQIIQQRIPFDEEDAALAAQLFNRSGRRRGSLVDCMIAATALLQKAHLATENPSDFRRFEEAGLPLRLA
jgi:predicted nucleic acid-binding protein